MLNHEAVEGVIYETPCLSDHCHAKFYLRPKMSSHRGLDIPHHLLMVRAKDLRAWRFKNTRGIKIEDLTHALLEAHYVHSRVPS